MAQQSNPGLLLLLALPIRGDDCERASLLNKQRHILQNYDWVVQFECPQQYL